MNAHNKQWLLVVLLLLGVVILAACGGGGDDDSSGDGGDTPPVQTGGDDSSNNDSPPPTADEAAPPTQAAPPTPAGQDSDIFDEEEEFIDDEPTPEFAPTFFNEEGTPIPQELVTPFVPPSEQEQASIGVVAPPRGQLGMAATDVPDPLNPDPPDTAPSSGFDYIYFEQTGGINDINLVFEVYSDGRVVIEGETLTAPQQTLDRIAEIIDTIDFFGMQSTFVGPPTDQEASYRYRMAVIQETRQRAIQAQDGYMPPEIIQLFSAVRSLVEGQPNVGGQE